MLVSCNCKILKLYSAPRSQKSRRGTYRSLKDGEGGRYGVLSVTNPNYEDIPPPPAPPAPPLVMQQAQAFNAFVAVPEPEEYSPAHSYVKMAYRERHFVERTDVVVPSALDCAFSGELSTSLAIEEIPRSPLPTSV